MILRFFMSVLVVLVLPTAMAADSKSIHTAIEWLRTACVSGENLEIKAEGDGGISFLKRGVQGKLYFSKKDARGVVDSLQGELQRDNLREQRECMQPYIDDKGFVRRADGERICQRIQTEPSHTVVIGRSTSTAGARWAKVCKLYDGSWSQEWR
jgi:hypothetical protein